MSLSHALATRADQKCEICTAAFAELDGITISPKSDDKIEHQLAICPTCKTELEKSSEYDINHWRCLNDSIWSELDAVKVVSYRMLIRLKAEEWARDLLDMMYLEDDVLEWAKDGIEAPKSEIIHKDVNGNILTMGDTVTLIQDLNVKGASFTAKRGTAVRRIRLVHDNPEHIEGKIEGQSIVILTKYVKKS